MIMNWTLFPKKLEAPYTAFIQPSLEYGAVIWIPNYKKKILTYCNLPRTGASA